MTQLLKCPRNTISKSSQVAQDIMNILLKIDGMTVMEGKHILRTCMEDLDTATLEIIKPEE